jgi:putative SOS response-associated peptidase YedK
MRHDAETLTSVTEGSRGWSRRAVSLAWRVRPLHLDHIAIPAGQAVRGPVTDRERGPSYNVSPTPDVYVVLDDGEAGKVDVVRWGLVPAWSKDRSVVG